MRRQRGITLVEILVTIFILSLLLAVGIPNFTLWIQNTQIRTGADAMLNGLQTARNEAIRRNTCVQVKFDTIAGQTGYRVNLCADPDGTPLLSRSHEESSGNAQALTVPAAVDTVSFNALGRVVDPNPSDGSATISQINLDNPTMNAADSRELRIVIPTGGGARLCDPQVLVGDPRAC